MKSIYTLLIFFIFFSLIGCSHKTSADRIFINAKVYTLDPSFSTVEAFAIKGGRVLATGSSKEILKKYSSDSLTDLMGKVVYPGFIDAHCHFYGYGANLREVNLVGSKSFEEVLDLVNAHSKAYPSVWIFGHGWDQNDWDDKTFPDKTKLDILFPDTPVLLSRIDGHAALANSKALELAGINVNSIVEGGSVSIKDGKPNGILIDNAISLVTKLKPIPAEKEIAEDLLRAQKNCFAVGLTSVHDAGLDKNVIDVIKALNVADSLRMRIYAMLTPSSENIDSFVRKGIYKTDYLNIRSVKLYADGALGSRGARMSSPYSDDSANSGLWLTSPEKISEVSMLADSFGYQVCTHCIGDEANHKVLEIYSKILNGKNDKRWRIEHAQVISLNDIKMFREFSIVPSIQPTHATSDMYWAEERLGMQRMSGAYAYKSLLSQNGWIPCGSDFPVENINPIYGFFAASMRKDQELMPKEGFHIDEALNREEALRGMTIWAAKAAFEEHEKGSLEVGKFADFVVCDKDLMTEPEQSIASVIVEQTWLGGKLVYRK